jgi:hypothetical protein
VSRRSRAAVARSAGGDRTLTIILGLVLLAAGVLAALVGFGVFGSYRAQRPLLDPMITSWFAQHSTAGRWIAIGAGVLLLLLGLW